MQLTRQRTNQKADREFSAGCFSFTVFNSDLLFSYGALTGFPTPLSLFSHLTSFTAEKGTFFSCNLEL